MYVLNVHIGLHALLIHLITRNWRLRDEHSLKLRDMTLYRVIQRSIDNAFTSKSLSVIVNDLKEFNANCS
jgi:hypothetical protein